MPFKSQAQRRKFAELLVKGKISPETFEEWNRETGSAKLPERVKPPRKTKAKKKSRDRSCTTKWRRNPCRRKKRLSESGATREKGKLRAHRPANSYGKRSTTF